MPKFWKYTTAGRMEPADMTVSQVDGLSTALNSKVDKAAVAPADHWYGNTLEEWNWFIDGLFIPDEWLIPKGVLEQLRSLFFNELDDVRSRTSALETGKVDAVEGLSLWSAGLTRTTSLSNLSASVSRTLPTSSDTIQSYTNKVLKWLSDLKAAAFMDVGTISGTVAAGDHTHNTSVITEGTNQYFTQARVRSTPLTGLSEAISRILPTASDDIVTLGGKARKWFADLKGAAFLDVGTTAGTVAAGDDSRIVAVAGKQNNLRYTTGVLNLSTENLNNWKTEGRYQLDGAVSLGAISSPKTLIVEVSRDTVTQTILDEYGRMAVRHCYGFAGSGFSPADSWSPWRSVVQGSTIKTTSELTNSIRRYNPNDFFGAGDYDFYNTNATTTPATTYLSTLPNNTWWHVYRRIHENGGNGGGFWVYEDWVELGGSYHYERYYFDDGRGWSTFSTVWTSRTLDFNTSVQNALKAGGYNDYGGRLVVGQTGTVTMCRDLTMAGPMSGQHPWAASITGTMTAFDTSRADYAGMALTSAADNVLREYTMFSRQSIAFRQTGRVVSSRWTVFVPTMAQSPDGYICRIGLMDTPSNPTNGMYYELVRDGAGFRLFGVTMASSVKTSTLILDQTTMATVFMTAVRTMEVIVFPTQVQFHIPNITLVNVTTGLPTAGVSRQAFYCAAQSSSRILGVELFYQECIQYNA